MPTGGGSGGSLTCNSVATEISGTVYEDYDHNGIKDSNEPLGVHNIIITATDESGNTSTATTDAAGEYTFAGLTPAETYRIEFTDLPSWATTTFFGADNGTKIQFLQPGSCANLGLAEPSDYCDVNGQIAVPCYINGDPLITTGANPAGLEIGMPSFLDNTTGTAGNMIFTTQLSESGSLWGLAADRGREKLYSSAIIRRHTGLGSLGIGGIYVLDYSAATPTYAPLVDLDAFYDVGSIGVNGAGGRGLSGNSTQPNADVEAYAKVFREGLGDIEITDDGNTLYAVNLFQRNIIKVDLTGYNQTGAPITATNASIIDFPMKSCTGGIARPFGLKLHRGKLYAGLTCTAETIRNVNNLNASIYSYDFDTSTWTEELSFSLAPPTFDRIANNHNPLPWTDDYNDLYTYGNPINIYGFQPLLGDIEFNQRGDMIFSIMDRTSYQFGSQNYLPNNSNTLMSQVFPNGEIAMAGYNNGSFVLENNGSIPSGAGNGVNTNDGFGGGNYFSDKTLEQHQTLGAFAFNKRNGRLSATTEDPINYNSGGIFYYDQEDDGDISGALQLFTGGIVTLGKGAALGDIELLCSPAPLEIGNYVWLDSDMDGVQDPEEAPIAGVTMELYDASGNLVASDITDANGEYYFSSDATDDATWITPGDGLDYLSDYYIVAGGNGQFSAGSLNVNGSSYSLTTANNATGANADLKDSDGTIAMSIDPDFDGEPYVLITTGNPGESNHDYDFGFTDCPSPNCFVILVTRN